MKLMLNRIRKYMDLSLAHVTYEDSQLLARFSHHKSSRDKVPNRHSFRLVVYAYEYGFFIPLTEILLDSPDVLASFGYSDAFIRVIRYAKEKECRLLVFDRDAETTDELEKFEW